MIEAKIIQYLSANMTPNVSGEVPSPMPASFVVVEKTGGSQDNHIPNSTIAIQSYAESQAKACELNDDVIELMLYGLIEEPEIASVRLNATYNYTDTTTKRNRYQAVFNITHY